jgi:hypothetical protein
MCNWRLKKSPLPNPYVHSILKQCIAARRQIQGIYLASAGTAADSVAYVAARIDKNSHDRTIHDTLLLA